MLLITIEKMVSRRKTASKQKMLSKEKNDKVTVGVQYSCDEYKIDKFGLMDGDLYLTNVDNQKLDLTGIANKYLRKN